MSNIKNGDLPAMPTDERLVVSEQGMTPPYNFPLGLTKREYFAGLAMQAILSKYSGQIPDISKKAVQCADALLKELDNEG